MTLVAAYDEARQIEEIGRLRRILALRAMVASGESQRDVARELGISQPAVSKQLKAAPDLSGVHPETLLDAAAPVIKRLAADRGFTRLAVFGSVARREAGLDSDFDFLVETPRGTTISDMVRFRDLLQKVLGRPVDLVSWGGLKPYDADIRHEAVLL